MLLLLNPRHLIKMLLLLRWRLTPHFCSDNTHVLVPHLDRSRDELGVDDMFAKEDECVAWTGNVFGVLL